MEETKKTQEATASSTLEAPFWFFPLIPSTATQVISGLGSREERKDEDNDEEKEEHTCTANQEASVLWIKDCKEVNFNITINHHLDKIVLENLYDCEVHIRRTQEEGSCDYLEVADYCQDLFVTTSKNEDEDEEESSTAAGLVIPLVAVDNGDRISFVFPPEWGTNSGGGADRNCVFVTAGSTGIFVQIAGAKKRHKVPRGDHDITLQVAVIRDQDDSTGLRSMELLSPQPNRCASARERLALMGSLANNKNAPSVAEKEEGERGKVRDRKAFMVAPKEFVQKELLAEDVLERGKKRSGHATEEELKEIFDTPEVLKEKVAALARLFKQSKHAVAYTGAGVSTSSGIPDYRGPQGMWTLRDRGEERSEGGGGLSDLKKVHPTPTHMALAEMVRKGYIKHVASTNLDGLHRKSGVSRENLSELHGNCFVEKCVDCGALYEREEDVGGDSLNHLTGNDCDDEDCRGQLVDNIINFGEFTERPVLDKARHHGNRADLTLVLGTSMKVTAACYLPLEVLSLRDPTHPEGSLERSPGNMVIVNLQKTPFDDLSAIRIFARCDEVIAMLAEELDLEVPAYVPPTPPPNISRITYL